MPPPKFQDSDLRRPIAAWFPSASDLRALPWAHVRVRGAAGRGWDTPAWLGIARFVRSSYVNRALFGTKVRTSFAAMQSMLQLCGFNATTVEDVFSAIGTIKRNADTTAAVSSSSAAVASSVIAAPISADASVQTDQHPSEASSTPASPAIAAAPAKTSHKWIPKPIPGTADIKSFFSRSPKTVAVSASESSTSAEPSQPPQSTSQPASESVSLAPAVVKTAVFKHQPRLRPGQIIKRVEDVTKLKNSVTTLRAEKRSLVSAARGLQSCTAGRLSTFAQSTATTCFMHRRAC